ncbi:MAG: diacylglycerol kinase family protein [Aestuariivirga sp.]
MSSNQKKQLSELTALILINEQAGTVRTLGAEGVAKTISAALSPHFRTTKTKLFSGDIAEAFKKEAAGKKFDILIAGGGDGTLAYAARLVLDHPDLILGVLPLGTMNLFTQSLGFAPALDAALALYGHARISTVDVAKANDQIFLHQFSLGLQPKMARLREHIGYRSRLTKMMGSVRAFVLLAFRGRYVRVDMETDGNIRRVRAPLLVVTNNLLSEKDGYRIAKSMEGGILGVYELKDLSLLSLFGIGWDYLARRIHENPLVEVSSAKSVTLSKSKNHKRIMKTAATIDGEIIYFDYPIKIEVMPKSLRVLRPQLD